MHEELEHESELDYRYFEEHPEWRVSSECTSTNHASEGEQNLGDDEQPNQKPEDEKIELQRDSDSERVDLHSVRGASSEVC